MTRVSAPLCAVGGVAALLLLSGGSDHRVRAALPSPSGVPVAQAAAAAPFGRSFNGVAAVGALFTESDGELSAHFCTASVVNSAAGTWR